MSRPIPEKLIRDIGRAEVLEAWEINRVRRTLRSSLTRTLLVTLPYVCYGYSNAQIAERLFYSEDAVKDHVRRLLVIFRARNRAHLAAKAVARGIVDMGDEV